MKVKAMKNTQTGEIAYSTTGGGYAIPGDGNQFRVTYDAGFMGKGDWVDVVEWVGGVVQLVPDGDFKLSPDEGLKSAEDDPADLQIMSGPRCDGPVGSTRLYCVAELREGEEVRHIPPAPDGVYAIYPDGCEPYVVEIRGGHMARMRDITPRPDEDDEMMGNDAVGVVYAAEGLQTWPECVCVFRREKF